MRRCRHWDEEEGEGEGEGASSAVVVVGTREGEGEGEGVSSAVVVVGTREGEGEREGRIVGRRGRGGRVVVIIRAKERAACCRSLSSSGRERR